MDFYEIGIYLLMILVASGAVFGVMWMIIRSMVPRKRRVKRGAGGRKAQIAADGKKRDKQDGLMQLKEYPESRLLPDGKAKKEKASASGKSSDRDSSRAAAHKMAETEKEDNITLPEAITEPEMPASEAAPAGRAADRPGGGLELPDLPSLDTLTDGEQEMPKEQVDLMSVFEVEEAEDSSTSDLAANLFDVDIDNITKLGSEISQFLGGLHSE